MEAAPDHAIAALLAAAFQDDPAFAWILPDPAARAVRLPRLFRLIVANDARAGFRLGDGAAATLWRRPGHARTGRGEMLRHAIPLARALGGGIGRALRVAAAIDAHLPAEPCWYLHYVGCAPDRRRQGLGTAAVRAGLARIGEDAPVYLETAREENLGFYTGLGFAVTAEWRVARDSPRFWSLRRGPR